MQPMPHGYTNATRTDGQVVVKRYLGPDSVDRQAREELALKRLAGLLPVPTLLDSTPGTSTTAYESGVPGQAAIADGHAASVLHACGRLLAQLQEIDPRALCEVGPGVTLVHNDFGPNNVLMANDLSKVRLLCDWEWVTVGDANTDLAWAEWIVRTHHEESLGALPALFDGYGHRPRWEVRQTAMLERARVHREFLRRWHGTDGERLWDDRLAAISSWREL